jgi:hypothetical protein
MDMGKPRVDRNRETAYHKYMTKVEVILEQARGLSPAEREQLVRLLAAQAYSEGADDEAAVGKRGLAAWTESTRGEDWSMFYPQALRDGKGSGS